MFEYLEFFGLAIIPLFMLWDAFRGERSYIRPFFWRLRGIAVTVGAVAISMAVATFWGTVFTGVSLFDLSGIGMFWGAVIGVLVYEFFHYWYHRTVHRVNWLWRAGHQMHHSAEAVDSFGAYYLHPFDVFWFTSLSSLVLFPLLGLSLEAGLIAAAFLGFNAISSMPTSARRIGWGISSSARKAIACITAAASTPTTTPTCRCGIWCSGPSATRAMSPAWKPASTSAPRPASPRC